MQLELPVLQRLLVLENAGWEEASLLAEAGVERAQAEAWLLGPSCLGALEENAKYPPLRLFFADLRVACCANLLGLGRLAEAAQVAEAVLEVLVVVKQVVLLVLLLLNLPKELHFQKQSDLHLA